jgi:hypothetical protein
MSDGNVMLHKALGVSVRVTEKYHGYGTEETDYYLSADLLVGDTVIFNTSVEHLSWMLPDQPDKVIEAVLVEFKDKLEGETG